MLKNLHCIRTKQKTDAPIETINQKPISLNIGRYCDEMKINVNKFFIKLMKSKFYDIRIYYKIINVLRYKKKNQFVLTTLVTLPN